MLDEIYAGIGITDLFPEAKKYGDRFKMLCPFHNEKTPSLVIYHDQKRFHCFGCGKDGSYADYVIEKGWASDFKEAVKYLAKLAGKEINFNPFNKRILEVNEIAAKLFDSQLMNNKSALGYLKGRGITLDSIKKFRLGYAGEGYISTLKSKGVSVDEMKQAGLIVDGSHGDRELFRNRIMFAIIKSNAVVAFAGRVLDDSKPKYINSPNTSVFCKGSTLYGLNPQGVKSLGYGISVEGYTDVIALDQIGFDNAFAPMGTAFATEQLKEVRRYTDDLILLNDSDDSGVNATSKVLEEKLLDILFAGDMTVKVGLLPEGEDPQSYIQKSGDESMMRIIDSAQIGEVFLVRKKQKERLSVITRIASAPKDISAEIFPYISDAEKVLIQELSAKKVLEMLRGTGKLLHRTRNIEIRRWFGLLLVYQNDHFLFWQKEGENPFKQAAAIAKILLRGR